MSRHTDAAPSVQRQVLSTRRWLQTHRWLPAAESLPHAVQMWRR